MICDAGFSALISNGQAWTHRLILLGLRTCTGELARRRPSICLHDGRSARSSVDLMDLGIRRLHCIINFFEVGLRSVLRLVSLVLLLCRDTSGGGERALCRRRRRLRLPSSVDLELEARFSATPVSNKAWNVHVAKAAVGPLRHFPFHHPPF